MAPGGFDSKPVWLFQLASDEAVGVAWKERTRRQLLMKQKRIWTRQRDHIRLTKCDPDWEDTSTPGVLFRCGNET
ncbi:hypothetical protein QQP08_015205 [Theobroma cacao]|nr:hypothetical protein QQP08_015205 [Theobroma cacao]